VDDNGTFVLTSGRSGSTFLARLLNEHPDLVVISDVIEPAIEDPYFDRRSELDGPAFWDLLTRPALPERIAHWRRCGGEELLYLPESDGDVSLLMAYTLPFLTDDPWRLREELEAAVSTHPVQAAPDHLSSVAAYLRDRFSGRRWIERTGGSLPHAASIIEAWPDAKYVMLLRDPVETAISMQTGSFFRLCLAIEDGSPADWLDPRFADAAALASMIERWTIGGATAIETVPAERVLVLTYERLVTEPVAALTSLVHFVLGRNPSDDDLRWARKAASWVAPAPARTPELSTSEVTRIREACPQTRQLWARLRAADR
jgi:hypothetical protein